MRRLIVIVSLLFAFNSHAEAFKKPGHFEAYIDGWKHQEIPLKTDFVRCEECDFPIGIEIGYGETLPPKGMFRTNGEFIKLVSDESKAKILSKELLSSRVLPDASLIVKRVGVSELGGLNVLQAQSNFKSKGQVIWLNAMMAVHKNKIVLVTLIYQDGAMDEFSNKQIGSLFGSIRFL